MSAKIIKRTRRKSIKKIKNTILKNSSFVYTLLLFLCQSYIKLFILLQSNLHFVYIYLIELLYSS
jgi:hypothetical protein